MANPLFLMTKTQILYFFVFGVFTQSMLEKCIFVLFIFYDYNTYQRLYGHILITIISLSEYIDATNKKNKLLW